MFDKINIRAIKILKRKKENEIKILLSTRRNIFRDGERERWRKIHERKEASWMERIIGETRTDDNERVQRV